MSASRFFATLYWAPASRIFRRRSVDCAPERPWLRVITTTLVSEKTFFSSSTRSAFCERSMPTPNYRPERTPNEVQQKPRQRRLNVDVRGAWIGGAAAATHDETLRSASNDSCPRLGCGLRGEPQQLSRTSAPGKPSAKAGL